MFISLAAFTVFGVLDYPLTAAIAFPALSLFNLLRFPLMMLPEQILSVIQGKVSLARIQDFMDVGLALPPSTTCLYIVMTKLQFVQLPLLNHVCWLP